MTSVRRKYSANDLVRDRSLFTEGLVLKRNDFLSKKFSYPTQNVTEKTSTQQFSGLKKIYPTPTIKIDVKDENKEDTESEMDSDDDVDDDEIDNFGL